MEGNGNVAGVVFMKIRCQFCNYRISIQPKVHVSHAAMQMASQQNIQQAEMQQQQIAAFAQQSMMGSALGAALQDDGFMNKAGNAAGTFMGRMMGMR